jgi:hypothetical protein
LIDAFTVDEDEIDDMDISNWKIDGIIVLSDFI